MAPKTAVSKFLSIIAPRKRGKKGGSTATGTYDPSSSDGVISIPAYNEFRQDLFETRRSDNSQTLIKRLLTHDPDMSAALNAYLTVAATQMTVEVRTLDGELDKDGVTLVHQIIDYMTRPTDYTLGFQMKRRMSSIVSDLRWMLLMRGGIGAELILDKTLAPSDIRIVDMASIEWIERKSGEYKPQQIVEGLSDPVELDIPTFHVEFFRKDPTEIYSDSPFVSSINTIAARHLIINELYRVMKHTGFPRMELKVLEEILHKNAPADVKADKEKLKEWMNSRIAEIAQAFSNLRSDQAFIHTDAVEVSVLNDRNPSASLQVEEIINTLNSQNQAALKTMSTIIGRGESGVNTASVESRIFAMNADQLNEPIAGLLSNILSMALHLNGYQGFATVKFAKAELRPEMELEPQKTMKASRLQTELSLGTITDEEYHAEVHGRPRPDNAPELAGTGFANKQAVGVDETEVSPNDDPMGRGLTPEGSDQANSN